MLHRGRLFGTVAMTYLAESVTAKTSRLFARILVWYQRNPLGAGPSLLLPAGDLVMMRRQMLNFAKLAGKSPPET